MTKAELIERIARSRDLPADTTKKCIAVILDAAFEELVLHFVRGKVTRQVAPRFTFPGFGTFTKKKRSARRGVNPRTLEPMEIEAAFTIDFKPGVAFRECLNDPQRARALLTKSKPRTAKSGRPAPTPGATTPGASAAASSGARGSVRATRATSGENHEGGTPSTRGAQGSRDRGVVELGRPLRRRLMSREDEDLLEPWEGTSSARDAVALGGVLRPSPLQRVTGRAARESKGSAETETEVAAAPRVASGNLRA